MLDEVVATYFAGPRSYTGEDVVEVSAHGSPVVLEAIVRGSLAAGLEAGGAWGVYTEGVSLGADRSDAGGGCPRPDSSTTMHQARTAASQMGGAVSREVAASEGAAARLIATMEAGIDFAEDDIDVLPGAAIGGSLRCEPLARWNGAMRMGGWFGTGFGWRLWAAECGEVVAVQCAGGAGTGDCDGGSRDDAGPGDGVDRA